MLTSEESVKKCSNRYQIKDRKIGSLSIQILDGDIRNKVDKKSYIGIGGYNIGIKSRPVNSHF